MYLCSNLWLPGYCRIRLIGFKSTKIIISRDYDVITWLWRHTTWPTFLNCSMTHAKRLSTSQYKPHPSTVFRLVYTSFRKCMGKTVSIYLYGYLSIITKPKSVLVVNLSRLFHINITNIRSKKEYKRYHSNFYHIDSTLSPHRFSTVLPPGGF